MALAPFAVRDPLAPPRAGSWQPGKKNFFCPDCGAFTKVEPDEPDPPRCATPGCGRERTLHVLSLLD